MTFLSKLKERATLLRIDSIRATTQAGSGHPTSCMSVAELVAALYFHLMKFESEDWNNQKNDRLILSKGHAAPVIYAAWKQLGLIDDKELLELRGFGSMLEGHPTRKLPMSEAATGSLGQGLAIGAGMVKQNGENGGRCFVLMGDGELAEGSVWEAAAFATAYRLKGLIGIVDCNGLGQTGSTACGETEYKKRFEAFGWQVKVVDGHDIKAVIEAVEGMNCGPAVLLAKTTKGKGYSLVEGRNGFHGKAFTKDEADKAICEIRRREPLLDEKKVVQPRLKAEKRTTKRFSVTLDGTGLAGAGKEMSTREAFGIALCDLGKVCDDLRVLDGDVGNSTFTNLFEKKFPERFTQSFIAEQTMIGLACGMEARGALPFAATFGAFMTRAHDQIRMAGVGGHALRLSGSHAGVSIGQDGPSQMGLEDIAMIRSVPNSVVLYPCDAISAYRLVEAQANYSDGISYLRTTRMATPLIYKTDEPFKIGGLKVVRQSSHDKLVIVGAGITLHEAIKASDILAKDKIAVTVVDLYSVKPLDAKKLTELATLANNRVLTVEDHYLAGGLGEAVASALATQRICVYTMAVMAIPGSGKPEEVMRAAGIDALSIVQAAKEMM